MHAAFGRRSGETDQPHTWHRARAYLTPDPIKFFA